MDLRNLLLLSCLLAPAARAGMISAEAPAVAKKSLSAVVKVELPNGHGSGFLVSSDGLIATNAHLVEDLRIYELVSISFEDKTRHKAFLVAKSAVKDIAFLKIVSDRTDWPILEIQTSLLSAGEPIFVQGSPFYFDFSFTAGVVSNPRQMMPGLNRRMVQFDASINPGNSGGPVLNEAGKAAGIASRIFSLQPAELAAFAGLDFAIPGGTLANALNDYHRTGRILTADLGALFESAAGLEGAWIRELLPAGSAAAADFRPGDKILAVNGRPLPSSAHEAVSEIEASIYESRPGEAMEFLIERHDASDWKRVETLSITVLLGVATDSDGWNDVRERP